MAVVSISEASRLVGKTRQTLYNDRDSGKLSWTTLETGKPGIDTAELQRVYGQLKLNPVGQAVRNVNFDTQDGGADSTVDPTVHAVLETELKGAQQRIELLERMLSLEAAARPQQRESQRARQMAQAPKNGGGANQKKLLEYIAPVKPASHDQARTVDMQTGQTADTQAPASARQASNGRGWLSRLWRRAA